MRVKLLNAARIKTKKVQTRLAVARDDLHDSNADLADSAGGLSEPSRASVRAALDQNSSVEAKLEDAVVELDAVAELLKVAEAKNAEGLEPGTPGARSGQGSDTVLAHIRAAASSTPAPDDGNSSA